MLIKEVMTINPATCKATDTLDTVARLMLEHDCGEIPVCEGKKLVGVVTDRDITCRAVALGKTPEAVPASEVMSRNVYTIHETARLDDALDLMEEKLVRRLPVVDDNGNIIGILSQADLMAKVPTLKVARTMKHVAKKTRKRAFAAV